MATGELTARIAGSGSYLPARVLDNAGLFEMDTIREAFDVERARGSLRDEDAAELSPAEVFDRWSRQVTGIRERRVIDPARGESTESMSAEAGERALEAAGMEAEELDLIVAASLTESLQVPNLSCSIADRLGVPHVGGYALNAACAGFVYAFATGYAFIRAGVAENVLVTAGDTLSDVTDYSDPKLAVLFGDGAGAVVLTAARGDGGVVGPPYLTAEYSFEHMHLLGQYGCDRTERDPYLRMGGGPHVLRNAIHTMSDAVDRALERAGLEREDVDFVVPHQANLRITRGLERQLRLPRGRVIHTIEEYGNMSASTVAITLDELLRGRHGELPDPATIVLTAVGGGYTSGAAVVRHSATA